MMEAEQDHPCRPGSWTGFWSGSWSGSQTGSWSGSFTGSWSGFLSCSWSCSWTGSWTGSWCYELIHSRVPIEFLHHLQLEAESGTETLVRFRSIQFFFVQLNSVNYFVHVVLK